MKVALVYDRVNKWGGAERVLLALHRLFPQAPLFTSVYDKSRAHWADVFNVRTSFLGGFPLVSSNHEFFAALMPIAFESFDFSEFDLVISITSESAKGIITRPGTCHICYCLTPTRYLWSGYETYFSNPLLRFVSTPFVSYLQNWDRIAAQRPDFYYSISNEVSTRIKKYYKRESEVIYPPLGLRGKISKQKREDFYILVGRFVPYKKIDLAIEAFNKTGQKLKIVGSGRGEKALKKRSKPNIEFLTDLTDKDLSYLYQRAKALIFPGIEDFGLAMVEAQSFGTPVIAFRGGGSVEIIIEGKTGEFFDDMAPESLVSTLKRFDNKSYNSLQIRKNAERFTFENFKKKFLTQVLETFVEYKTSL